MVTVYNTLTKKHEELKVKGKKINLFVCGPTVYDYAHIGHAKTYIQFDTIVKYLRNKGFDVTYLQNITDIDDKIIQRAAENKEDWKKLSERFEETYHADMKALGVDSVSKHARATDYVPAVVKQIQALLDNGHAYEIEDGIYFDLSTFSDYGRLSGRETEDAEDAVSRIDEGKGKRNKGDFALWKRSKEGEPVWDAPWFAGRPGWHIEDTALTETEFGAQYDVHGGARDLIFPHHEAEIALMESASGKKPLVRYWLHTGFLNVEGQKMSKSLRNFITIKDALTRWGALPLRFLFASSHYRGPINFTEDSIEAASAGLETLQNTLVTVRGKIVAAQDGEDDSFIETIGDYKSKFYVNMDDDFNTPKAMAVVFELAHALNGYIGAKWALEEGLAVLVELLGVLGIVLDVDFDVPAEVQQLVDEREKARTEKDWAKSDSLRDKIRGKGFVVDDTAHGAVVKRLK